MRSDYLARGYSKAETAEFDSPVTIDGIAGALTRAGHEVERVGGLDALIEALAAGRSWDLVFNIAEGMHGYGREAVIPALLEARGIACTFSDPLALAVCLHKPTTKRVVRDAGVPTPEFAVIATMADLDGFALPFPVFAKPVAEGTSKGVTGSSLVHDAAQLAEVCERLLAAHSQPVLVERYLPGREFTVGIVGSGAKAKSIGVMEVLVGGKGGSDAVYCYDTKQEYLDRVTYHLATDAQAQAAAELAVDAWRALDCRDAGRVDVRLDENGQPRFIEANPLPGLHPIDSDLPIICRLGGIEYDTLIRAIVAGACERCGLDGEARTGRIPAAGEVQ
nr:D-alanine--D-alanine ligase [Desulfobaculum xiamenense]